MSDSLDFLVKLTDGVSGPAQSAAASFEVMATSAEQSAAATFANAEASGVGSEAAAALAASAEVAAGGLASEAVAAEGAAAATTEVAAASVSATAAMRAEAAAIRAQTALLNANTGALKAKAAAERLAGGAAPAGGGAASGAAKGAPSSFEKLQLALKGGGAGGAGERLGHVSKLMGGIPPLAIAAAAAVAYLAYKIVSAAIDFAKFGFTAADAAMSARDEFYKANLSIAAQSKKWTDNIAGLFSKINVTPLAVGVQKVIGLFDAATGTGSTMQFFLTSIFNQLASGIGAVAPYVVAFFQGMIIGALKIYIAMKPVIGVVSALFGAIFPGATASDIFAKIGEAVAFMAIPFVVMATIAATLTGLMLRAASAIMSAFQAVADVVGSVVGFVSGAASAIGAAIGDGIEGGISNAIGRVVAAARNLAGAAMQAIKSMLGIASPSRVMAQFGGHTAAGFAQGMDAGASDVASSAASLASAPLDAASPVAGSAPASASRGASGGSMNVGGVTITINGVANAQELMERLPAALADAFESIALQMGTAAA